MYRVHNIPLWLDENADQLTERLATKLGVDSGALASVRIVRAVLDARKKGHPRYVHTLEFSFRPNHRPKKLPPDVTAIAPAPQPEASVDPPDQRPIIVGTGPAGLFCAWGLLERGVRSVLVERGKPVVPRRKDVAKLMRDGSLDGESNMNFGEGGAGAYTDGKLSTRVNHPMVRKVISLFAEYGAPDQILTDGKPHIGSDLLPGAVANIREALISGGCEVRFESKVTDLVYRDDRTAGVRLADGAQIESDRVVFAPGNSARELFERFAKDRRVFIEPKPFAIGFRAEHPQALINRIQYGAAAEHPKLPPADYKLAENFSVSGQMRGVYSFCMCPGGVVVPTPTEEGLQCTNGMSNSRRNSKFANAGVVVSVTPEDFEKEGFGGPLAGLAFQRHWEKAAYELGEGNYFAPAQRASDYLSNRLGKAPGRSSYRPGLAHQNLNQLFPVRVTEAIHAALRRFNQKMPGFTSNDALLIGIESRTSSPVRISRGDDLQSVSLKGLYPAGEGCGYAGGIVSSAVDGLRIAKQICDELAA